MNAPMNRMLSFSRHINRHNAGSCKLGFYPIALLLLFFWVAMPRQVQAQCDIEIQGGGCWFVAPEVDQLHGDAPIFLRITTYTEAITATLSMPARPTFTPIVVNIPAGEFHSMDLTPYKALIESSPFNAVLNTGLLLEVTGVATAYYEVASTVNPGIFNLKGDVALGRHFFIPAQTAFVNNTSLPGRSGFVVVATEDNTEVTITPKNDMVGHPLPAGAFIIMLDRGETYSALAIGLNPSDRLNGSEVTSTKPVAVTIFDDNVFVPGHWDLCGDQIVPIEHIGTEYIAVKGNGGSNERIYVLATQNSTQVYIDGGSTPVATINRGEQYSRSFTGVSHYITTSKPTYVMHMAGIGGELGHSQMPPIGCSGVSEMGFVRTSSGQFGLMILVPTGSEDDFIINGNPSLISASSFTVVPGTGGQWKSYYANLGLPVGQNFVENTTSNFHMAILNNLGASTVYGYYTRFGLSQPNLGPDQIACNRDLLPMNLQTRITADEFLWSNGSTGSELTVTEPGTYWVRSRAGGCIDQYDTITITNIDARLLGARKFDFCGSFSVSIPMNFPGSDDGTLTVHADSMSAVNGTSPLSSLTLTTEGTYFVRLETDCGCFTVKGIELRSYCPPLAVDDVYTIPEDVVITLPVLTNDSDPDGSLVPGSVTVILPPQNGTVVVNPSGTLTYTPNANWHGTDTLTYQVTDNDGLSAQAQVVIVVLPVNDPPVAVDDAATTPEDVAVTIPVLANDSDPDNPINPANVTIAGAPAHGTAVVNPDGSITYTPNANWHGTETFTYVYCDDDGGCDAAVVTVTVTDVNDPPVALDDVASTPEDTPLSIPILANDSDPDGSLLPGSVVVLTPPVHGDVTVQPDGSLLYTPDPNYHGPDSLVYQVCDDDGACAQATVYVTVTDVNDPPIAVDDVVSTPEDTPINIPVLGNDSDPDGSLNPGSVIVVDEPANGTVFVNPDGSITYTPDSDYHGPDSFTYQVCDDDGACDVATVTVNVQDVNDPPIAVDDVASTLEDTPVTTAVLGNDSDPDGSLVPGSVSIISGPAHGTVTVNGDGSITYTPTLNYNGPDSYAYQVCDDDGLCDQATVTLTVGPVNDPPVAVNDVETTLEDTPVTVDVLVNDSDPDGPLDPASVTVISGPSHGSAYADPITGEVIYTPEPDWFGTDVLTYQVCDFYGACDQATITITVGDVNDPPIAVDDAASTLEDTPVNIAVLNNDNDPDGTLVLSSLVVLSGPSNGTITVLPDGTITYVPGGDFNGSDSFTYQICDDDGACDQAVVTISVGDVNDPPVALDDVASTPEDTPVTVPVLVNDSDSDGTLVPTSVSIVSGPAHGTVTLNPDGSITYTPSLNYHGPDSFVYQVCDDDGACDQATVSISVGDVNDPPIAVDDSRSTLEDVPVTVPVLDNDSDVDGILVLSSLSIVTPPAHGTVVVNADGTITYTPNTDYFGSDAFVYQICDDDGACDQATVSINVGDENDPPIAVDDVVVTPEDTPVTTPVLVNDSDPDGVLVPGSVSIVNPPAHGSVVVNPDGSITYTPDANYHGPDSYTYQVCDDDGACDAAAVSITVTDVNDPPVAVDDAVTTPEDTPVLIVVLNNDSDSDGSLVPGSVSIVSGPAHGTLLVNPDGSITYTPNTNYHGPDAFSYQVCDNDGACDQATVTISVLDVNDPPVAVDDAVVTPEDTPVTVPVLVNDSDVDGVLVISTVTIVTDPLHGTVVVNPDGTITYSPNVNYHGPDSFVYQVCDDDGACDEATVTISVLDVNDPPFANDDTDNTSEDTPVTTDVLANDHDPDGTLVPSTVTIVLAPANGIVVVNPDGSITYTPDPGWNGTDHYSYQVCDDDGACDQAMVTITVGDVNDPPIAVDDTEFTPEDTPVTTVVLNNDYDTDGFLVPASVTILVAPSHGTLVVHPDGSITYTPEPDYFGTDAYTYQVCDDDGACDAAVVTITTGDVNDPPVAVDDAAFTVEDTPVTTTVLANDHDPDGWLVPGSVTIVIAPANGTVVVNPDGTITYTPSPDWFGVDVYTYEVCDNDGLCDDAQVTVAVGDVNDPPIAVDDIVSTAEDTPITVPVMANDSDPDGFLVPASVSILDVPSNGLASVNPDGSITYYPNPDWYGTDTLVYQVCDDDGACDQALVIITIGDVNDPPIAEDDIASTPEDVAVVIPVLINDYDPDGYLVPGSVTVVTPPTNGTVTVMPDGSMVYTPNADWNGNDSYTYQVCDDDGLCDDATVTILVGDVNDPPVAVDDALPGSEDTPINVVVLSNDYDIDGMLMPGTVAVLTAPLHGSTAVLADGTVTYSPDLDWNGVDSFRYQVCDDDGLCDDAWVVISIGTVVDGPVAVNDLITTPEDSAITVDPLVNDSDPDGDLDPTSVAITGGPSHGTASVDPATGNVTYTPDTDWYGLDTIGYVVCDLTGLCDSALIIILVTPVPDAPVAVDDYASTPEDVPVTIDILANDFDVETDINPGSVTILTDPLFGTVTVNPDGTVTFTPGEGFFGTDSFRYQVCDFTDLCDDAWVFVTTGEVPVALVAVDDAASTPEEQPVVIPVLVNDIPGDYPIVPGSLDILTDPVNGTLSVDLATGVVTYTPFDDWCGTDGFEYLICDTWGHCDTAWVTIVVACVDLVANDDVASTPAGEPVAIVILANDSPNADPDCVTLLTTPLHGTVVINPDGSVLYTPEIGYVGVDCFTYEVCDNLGVERDDALVCITMAEVDIIIPEVFTPNGDGFNETFEIIGIEQFPDNQLMVFNRWENLIYQADSYASQWDGTNMTNGEMLPDGTYFYVLVLDPNQKDSPIFKGFVAIQR